MRVLVFFDLPTLTVKDRRGYRKFRKALMKQGFIMMQESVYSKLVLNGTSAKTIANYVRKNAPESGLVQMLSVTEKQFASMEYVIGEFQSEYVITTDRLVVL